MVMLFMLLVVKQLKTRKWFHFVIGRFDLNFVLFIISLLDDIQRLNLKTLKWEHVATLANPIAAW